MMSLPYLDAMACRASALESTAADVPMRMVCMGASLGFVPKLFFPEKTGRDYETPLLLKPLEEHRNDYTVFSGLDHGNNAQGGHRGVHAFLSGVLSKNASGFTEANISVDQKAAQFVGAETRYPSMQFAAGTGSGSLISWSNAGVATPPIDKLSTIYSLLFRQIDPKEQQATGNRYSAQSSILDLVKTDADYLMKKIGKRDQQKLDQYFTSVREVEKQLTQSKAWLSKEKPNVNYELPDGADQLDFVDRVPLYYDLITLALQTDSTRIITLGLSDIGGNYGGFDITRGHHQLTHHGKVPSYLDELTIIEKFHTTQYGRFLSQLKAVDEPNGKTLFDNTMTLLGSGMGNASSHSNKNLPLLLAGGGFQHGEHKLYSKEKFATPANNLFVSMLQRFGMETDQFNTANGTLTGLEVA